MKTLIKNSIPVVLLVAMVIGVVSLVRVPPLPEPLEPLSVVMAWRHSQALAYDMYEPKPLVLEAPYSSHSMTIAQPTEDGQVLITCHYDGVATCTWSGSTPPKDAIYVNNVLMDFSGQKFPVIP